MNRDRFTATLARHGVRLTEVEEGAVWEQPIRRLLTVGNPKTVKGEKRGYRTAGLHLFPHIGSGFQVCPKATAGCSAACLNTAGRGGFDPAIPAARKRRTWQFIARREEFMSQLHREIGGHVTACKSAGYIPAVRLNVLSDIRWENMPVTANGLEYPSLMAAYPYVQFYDYTKLANRRDLPGNYHLTFSAADGNETDVDAAFDSHNVAMVLRSLSLTANRSLRSADIRNRAMQFPATYLGRPVINGDISDLRFKDQPTHGAIVALRAKGQAVHDTSGFVRDLP